MSTVGQLHCVGSSVFRNHKTLKMAGEKGYEATK